MDTNSLSSDDVSRGSSKTSSSSSSSSSDDDVFPSSKVPSSKPREPSVYNRVFLKPKHNFYRVCGMLLRHVVKPYSERADSAIQKYISENKGEHDEEDIEADDEDVFDDIEDLVFSTTKHVSNKFTKEWLVNFERKMQKGEYRTGEKMKQFGMDPDDFILSRKNFGNIEKVFDMLNTSFTKAQEIPTMKKIDYLSHFSELQKIVYHYNKFYPQDSLSQCYRERRFAKRKEFKENPTLRANYVQKIEEILQNALFEGKFSQEFIEEGVEDEGLFGTYETKGTPEETFCLRMKNLQLKPEHILHAQWKNSVFRQAHCIIKVPDRNKIHVVTRGTKNFHDVVTNLGMQYLCVHVRLAGKRPCGCSTPPSFSAQYILHHEKKEIEDINETLRSFNEFLFELLQCDHNLQKEKSNNGETGQSVGNSTMMTLNEEDEKQRELEVQGIQLNHEPQRRESQDENGEAKEDKHAQMQIGMDAGASHGDVGSFVGVSESFVGEEEKSFEFYTHLGIFRSSIHLFEIIYPKLREILKKPENDNLKVKLIGHSLGGAVSSLMQLFVQVIDEPFVNNVTSTITFGPPPVILPKNFEAKLPFELRCVNLLNKFDIVPRCSYGMMKDLEQLLITFHKKEIRHEYFPLIEHWNIDQLPFEKWQPRHKARYEKKREFYMDLVHNKMNHMKLGIYGRLLLISHEKSSKSTRIEELPNSSYFEEIRMSSDMINDHYIPSYLSVLYRNHEIIC